MRRQVSLFLIINALLISVFLFSTLTKAEPVDYDPGEAVKLAQILDRKLIFIFYSPTCYYCQLFEENTLSDPEVMHLIEKHFILSKINVSERYTLNMPVFGEITSIKLSSILGMQGTPFTVFLEPPGDKYNYLTHLRGNVHSQHFKKVLHFLGREIYKEDVEFQSYSVGEFSKQFANYQPQIKEITQEELTIIQRNKVGLVVVEFLEDLESLTLGEEIILNLSDKSAQERFANTSISEGLVKRCIW